MPGGGFFFPRANAGDAKVRRTATRSEVSSFFTSVYMLPRRDVARGYYGTCFALRTVLALVSRNVHVASGEPACKFTPLLDGTAVLPCSVPPQPQGPPSRRSLSGR